MNRAGSQGGWKYILEMLAFELSLINQKEPAMQRSEGIACAKAWGQAKQKGGLCGWRLVRAGLCAVTDELPHLSGSPQEACISCP